MSRKMLVAGSCSSCQSAEEINGRNDHERLISWSSGGTLRALWCPVRRENCIMTVISAESKMAAHPQASCRRRVGWCQRQIRLGRRGTPVFCLIPESDEDWSAGEEPRSVNQIREQVVSWSRRWQKRVQERERDTFPLSQGRHYWVPTKQRFCHRKCFQLFHQEQT